MACTHTPDEVAHMKLVMAGSLANEFLGEFTQLIREFDTRHDGCTFQIVGESAFPRDRLHQTFARISPGFPVIDLWRFDRDSD